MSLSTKPFPDSPPVQNTRALMRQMGKAAGEDVHIEPDAQTELLDASIAQKGVICGGVPGGELCFSRKSIGTCSSLPHSGRVRRDLASRVRAKRPRSGALERSREALGRIPKRVTSARNRIQRQRGKSRGH